MIFTPPLLPLPIAIRKGLRVRLFAVILVHPLEKLPMKNQCHPVAGDYAHFGEKLTLYYGVSLAGFAMADKI